MHGFDSRKDIKKMIQKYVDGTATIEEVTFVEAYYAFQENKQEPELSENELEALSKETFDKIAGELRSAQEPAKPTFNLLKYITAAAILVVFVTTGDLFLENRSSKHKLPAISSNKQLEIKPGTSQATLTLADGSVMILDDKQTVKIKELPGLVISKTSKGELIYKASGNSGNALNLASNTIATPPGGQYQVFLPDGTHVWLNAESKLTFPESFAGKTRKVVLEGEGYFEVAKNKALPFHVLTGNQDVEVTGTHFNVNGYIDNNAINTTLLEGSITVHYKKQSKKIVPGQQAVLSASGPLIDINTADTEAAVAWKNGFFEFNNTSLRQIMHQLARWYDLQIDYSSLPEKRYNGVVPRSADLSRVLQMLEVTGDIRFKIEEQRRLSVVTK